MATELDVLEAFTVETREADLSFNHLGAFALMIPNTQQATDWLADNLAGDVLIFRGAIVVELDCVPSIVTGARAAGLRVEG